MTSFLSGSGFGGSEPVSSRQRALKSIDASKQTFANKDFVRNIQWLNESVTYMSQTMGSMQRGIDEANQNFIEQIQGLIADLLIIFAGGEPTGIDLGDLKFIFQGIGALLGINPDTPFPLNLVEAAMHLFSNFMVPLPQFTDIIFDAMIAWAEDLGFSDEAIDAMQEFDDAVVLWYQHVEDCFGILGDWLKQIFSMLGMGTGFGSINSIVSLWDEVSGLIGQIVEGPREALLSVLSFIVVILFKVLTFLVRLVDPMQWLDATGIKAIGPQLVPDINNKTTDWTIGSNANTSWIYDSTMSQDSSTGCFKTNGTGTNKRVLMQEIKSCTPGETYAVSGQVWWQDIPANANTFGPCIVFYLGANEVSQTNINAAANHGTTGGWVQQKQEIVVPQNVDGFRVGARVSSEINSGVVRVDRLSCTLNSGGVGGLADAIMGIIGKIPFIGPLLLALTGSSTTGGGGIEALTTVFKQLMDFVSNPFGLGTGSFNYDSTIQAFVNSLVPAGVLTTQTPIPSNLLTAIQPGGDGFVLFDPGFSNEKTLQGQGLWTWDWAGGIRTVRPGMIVVFYVVGTYELFEGDLQVTHEMEMVLALSGQENYPRPINLNHFEYIFVGYPGAAFPMEVSMAKGRQRLIGLIKQLPVGRKFILTGTSQGAGIISDIYDEIRYGSLQDRNDDLLAGVCWGNMRRETGVTFTDPVYGTYLDPSPDSSGASRNNLQNTESRWWEMTILDDPVSSVSNTNEEGYWIRSFFDFVNGNYGSTFAGIISHLLSPIGYNETLNALHDLLAVFTGGSPHTMYGTNKPFESQDDDRVFIQVGVDYINSLWTQAPPPPVGAVHQVLGVPVAVQAGRVIKAGAKFRWFNLPADVDGAMMVAINCYNAAGEEIGTVIADDCIIDSPEATNFTGTTVLSSFLTIEDTASARPLIHVDADVMTTGIVWVDDMYFQVDQQIDAAQLTNITNIPIIPEDKVAGAHGTFDLNHTWETLVDGLASAHGGEAMTGAQLSQLFALTQQTAKKASDALALAESLQQNQEPDFHPPERWDQAVAGTYTYDIPNWMVDGDLLDLVALGGGHAGSYSGWFAPGLGGLPGNWNSTTIVFGTDIPNTTGSLSVVVGVGGEGDTAGAGTNTTISGVGMTTLMASAGADFYTDATGKGPGNYTFADQPYFGGPDAPLTGPGNAPGGGGGGGYGYFSGWPGGDGAPGYVVITARQAP